MQISSHRHFPKRPAETLSVSERLIEKKHEDYTKACIRYRNLYYFTRLCAGLSAGILPFVVHSSPNIAIGLSIAVVVATVLDSVFNPKDKWKTFSRATDLLAIARLKASGEYDKYANQLSILAATENAHLEQLVNLDEIIEQNRGREPQSRD
ncbi:DUF4231 domain-containing protein [Pelagicoccus sp. SDUM812003]|uniref:DUF4231 domain-containing protein n=1 Tax=Pelagicoccus sp. SDUM812003 TaxID=3041267 RepID=UPI00280EE834|nr:DUF4231 domain-containing protein [Pelagicoccus sp. SDUM812003]MDQ8205385.1 DUF4231 domain-containing protein [Pelagicoccus sp. SDUM812003]